MLKETVAQVSAWLIVLSVIVQVAPIKINPWSYIAQRIGKAVNAEMLARLDSVESELRNVKDSMDEHNAVAVRSRIVGFGEEMLRNERHTKDSFDNVLHDIDSYEAYCESHKTFKNSITTLTIGRIKSAYSKLLETGEFYEGD